MVSLLKWIELSRFLLPLAKGDFYWGCEQGRKAMEPLTLTLSRREREQMVPMLLASLLQMGKRSPEDDGLP